MFSWKLNIFIRVIAQRMEAEQKSKEEIILDYPLLTEDEKTEILTSIGNGEV